LIYQKDVVYMECNHIFFLIAGEKCFAANNAESPNTSCICSEICWIPVTTRFCLPLTSVEQKVPFGYLSMQVASSHHSREQHP
jgi:hypothetical protein